MDMKDNSGEAAIGTAIRYGLIIVAIAVAIIAAVLISTPR
jgi:hypothetical protein